MIGETDLLVTKLVAGMHTETQRITQELADLRERNGFLAGFDAGIQEGYRRSQQDIRKTLGITSRLVWREDAAEAFDFWKKIEIEKGQG
jgi:hypothetical protein